MKKVPVNLISGPLGVGKTTAIRHLLESRPKGERWAVLVNEFGLVGLDAALLADVAEPEGIDIREVAGGCICCSAGFLFEIALATLLGQGPDRLLIEPTGLAALSGILDALDAEPLRDQVEVRSTICLLDPATFHQDLQREEVEDQIEAADALLANRSDLATAEQLEDFSVWAQSFFPRKLHVGSIEQGQLATDLLDLAADRQGAAPRADYRHGTDHRLKTGSATIARPGEEEPAVVKPPEGDANLSIVRRDHISCEISTIGWICWKELVFDAERAVRFLAKLTNLPNAQRTKAVLRTDDGWWSFNFTPDVRDARPTSYRRDSRIEVIVRGDDLAGLEALDEALRMSLVQDQAPAKGR